MFYHHILQFFQEQVEQLHMDIQHQTFLIVQILFGIVDDRQLAYHHSKQLPTEKFDAIICNWTLHFIKDKIQYLTDVYRALNSNGILILSDKTSLDPLAIHFYHNYKRNRGVSDQEIDQKMQSVKNIMHIHSPQWYLDCLNLLEFKKIQIIDASWCFTTFLCVK